MSIDQFFPAPIVRFDGRSTPKRMVSRSTTPENALEARVDRRVSLVLPCFNEESNIEQTIRSVQEWFKSDHIDGQIIVTDDGSTDGSLCLLRKLQEEMPNLDVVHHEKNQGYGAAVRSGCDMAQKEWIAFMDSDGQFQPSDLRRLLPLTNETVYVAGVREKRADTLQRLLNGRMYRLLVRVVLGVRSSDPNCGMKLFRRSLWPTIRPIHATGALINAEMFYRMKKASIPWMEVLVPHYPRLAGKPTGANVRVILRMFKELWRLKRTRSGMAPAPAAMTEPATVDSSADCYDAPEPVYTLSDQ
ncbi:MAG TPA: glycosyltransferase family 2 protein [Tepidisphaeraceae bacterium]|jgi:glycosyltransferase involved in cell wall biosynthesis